MLINFPCGPKSVFVEVKVHVARETRSEISCPPAYNIQFKDGGPILIDTLSFTKYVEGQAWIGYRQFCQHFLAPLALMSQTDVRLNQLAKA